MTTDWLCFLYSKGVPPCMLEQGLSSQVRLTAGAAAFDSPLSP